MLHCCCMTRSCHKEHPHQRKTALSLCLTMISHGYFRDPEHGGSETEQPMLFSTGGFKPPTLEKKHSADIRGQRAVKTFAKIIYTTEKRRDQRPQRETFYQTKYLTHL